MSSSAFDFKQKLQRVQPKPALPQEGMDAKLDEIAERHEFVSREPVLRVERMRGAEPIDVLGPVQQRAGAFIELLATGAAAEPAIALGGALRSLRDGLRP